MNNNLIYGSDGEVYGFLKDIITAFELDMKNPDVANDTIQEAIDEAQRLVKEEDEYNIYKCEYNPMGAFIFTRLIGE